MLNSVKRTLRTAVAALLVFSGVTTAKGQERTPVESLEALEFRDALTGFTRLMEEQPDDPVWSYYTGRCLVELNENLDEAIELLFSASTRGVPADVFYYLGLAYHRSYDFTNALRYFGRFEVEAGRQELKRYDVSHMMATSRSAKDITSAYNPFEVLNVSFIDLSDSLQFSQVKMKGGQLQRKSPLYFRDDENRDGITGLMFMPATAARGDYIYYSGFTRSGREGAQLFRVKKGAGRSWGDPEEIGALNSEGDEILPYFDPIEDDIYFATNGRPGIGGYDLFRSHYDRERDSWSEPVNMGFPVNSVLDEVLLLPGADLGMVMFFTTRQGTDSTLTVYRVHLAEPKEKTIPDDYAMLERIANLGDVAVDLLAELEQLEASPVIETDPSTGRAEPGLQESDRPDEPVLTQVTILPELSVALKHQAASDSLKDLATNARIRIRESDDPNDRWVWQQQIMLWEKKAKDEEALADGLYRQAEAAADLSADQGTHIPETLEVDTVIDDLTVYRFASGTERQETIQKSQPAAPDINRFELLDGSPYGTDRPIPVDLPLPAGAIYRIQVGAFSAEVKPDAFRGISPISAQRIPERGMIKYYAGEFSSYVDASRALSIIRSEGLEDAFIVAWYNGNPIATDRAKQLE